MRSKISMHRNCWSDKILWIIEASVLCFIYFFPNWFQTIGCWILYLLVGEAVIVISAIVVFRASFKPSHPLIENDGNNVFHKDVVICTCLMVDFAVMCFIYFYSHWLLTIGYLMPCLLVRKIVLFISCFVLNVLFNPSSTFLQNIACGILDVNAAAFIIIGIALYVVRNIIFVIVWELSLHKLCLLILPNIFDNIDFWDKFRTLYVCKYKRKMKYTVKQIDTASSNCQVKEKERKEEETRLEFYFGKISASEAQKKLLDPKNQHGSFLIRDSENEKDCYALCIRYADIIKQYRICRSDTGGFYLFRSQIFNTLQEFVDNYKRDAGGLCVTLRKSCSKDNESTAANLSYKMSGHWEIDRESLTFVKKLGQGSFGIVWEGLQDKRNVAIKTLKEGTMDAKNFIQEARIMQTLSHPHVVKLYGACAIGEPMHIITELIKHGSLNTYLRSNTTTLTLFQLLDMAAQTASGMAYLESRNFIHRDLAARNVLVGEDNLIKVADFGLARIIKEEESIAHTGSPFPIRWTPPEAALNKRFSTKSDVWSYGILLTELVTYGSIPYLGMTDLEVLLRTQLGYRMPCPAGCPPTLYKIMLDTWQEDPAKRPTFKDLQNELLLISIAESSSTITTPSDK